MQSHMSPNGFQGWYAFDGDYYREPDNVVRGAHMVFEDVEALALGSSKSRGDADIFGFGDGFEGGAEPQTALSFPPLASSGLSEFSLGFLGENVACLAAPVNERFTEADIPPPVPTDPLFRFQATTLFLSVAKPFHLGNQLLDFFSRGCDLVATVTKVNQRKFAIKVDVFWGNIMCSLKVHIYQDLQRQSCAVEFQRRGGDAASFVDAYEQASAFLAKKAGACTSGQANKDRSVLLQHKATLMID